MKLRVLAVSLAFLLAPMAAHATDDVAAAERLGSSCEGGNTRDCGLLGFFYYSGRGVEQDYARAAEFYRRACSGGSDDFALFCSNLGHMYENGRGVEQDYAQAALLQQQACGAGYAGSCTSLGTMYINGRGLMQDYAQASVLFGQSCEAGDSLGCRNLGLMHASGMGLIQDYVRAHALYNIASSWGEADSGSYRDRIARDMTPQQIAQAQALARRCAEISIAECLR